MVALLTKENKKENKKETRRMYWRRESIQYRQASGDATVLKRVFCDNFVIFHSRSKRVAFYFWNQWIVILVLIYAHFQFSWWSRDHFSAPFRGLYLPNAWLQILQTSKRHTSRVSAFHRYKLFPVGCAQDRRMVPKTRKMLFLNLAPPMLQNSGIFHDSTRPHLHCDGLPPKLRRSVVSI